MTENNHVWSVENQNTHIGTVYKMEKGYVFAHQGITDYFSTKPKLEAYIRNFGEYNMKPLFPTAKKETAGTTVYGYDVGCPSYNHLLHVKHRAPVFTKESNSKCFFAAGWYAIDYGGNCWQIEHCPKLLVLNRNKYLGPYHNEQEARTAAGKS
jgi:hypothetical protein